MVAIIDDFLAAAGPAAVQAVDVIVQFVQLGLLLVVIAWFYIMWRFDTRVNIREYSKGGKIINRTSRAMEIKEKRTGAPKLKFFGYMGFKGEVISKPPAECLISNDSRVTRKMYDFIKKDGLYYPVKNFVLGVRHEGKDADGNTKVVYSLEGSGLEIDRNFDAEQSIQNKLIEEAIQFRNRKTTEILASYALMIITIIVSGVVMWFAWKQFGNMAGAIASLGPPLREGIIAASQGAVGPG